jgi:predicted lipoprotein with Yx(FWY)xxD motif
MTANPTRTSRAPATSHRTALTLAGGLSLAALLLTACGGSSAGGGAVTAAAPSVATGALVGTASTSVGSVLVDAQGKAVYVFAADSPGHSNCTGSCLSYWPPVPAPTTLPPPPADVTARLGVLKRADGIRQLTVNGWPLYTYTGDTAPGTTAGQGVAASGGQWWVVSPSGDQVTSTTGASPTHPTRGY